MGSEGERGIRDEVPEEEIAEQKGQQTSACNHSGGEEREKDRRKVSEGSVLGLQREQLT